MIALEERVENLELLCNGMLSSLKMIVQGDTADNRRHKEVMKYYKESADQRANRDKEIENSIIEQIKQFTRIADVLERLAPVKKHPPGTMCPFCERSMPCNCSTQRALRDSGSAR
jgi:hypothetical protein